jgi:DNA-binding MarR family transcriptional regulator
MYIDRTTLTHNLDLLKKHGLIQIESSSDKRKRIVSITNRGKAQMTKALPLWERAQGSIMEKFGKGNWREINTGLNEISNIARFN